MDINNYFDEIMKYSHCLNWEPDWEIVKKIYNEIPDAYSVLTPFAYCYLEELIRSTTSDYETSGIGKDGKLKKRKVGKALIKLAKEENEENREYIVKLDGIEHYFERSSGVETGENRNGVNHGYMHPRFWTQKSYEKLIKDIAEISKFAKF